MPQIFVDLFQNIAVLLSLCLAYSFIYPSLRSGTLAQKCITGAVFGLFTILGMLTPFNYGGGIIFDGRSIIISLSALFGGPVPALITVAMASVYRLALGGTGAAMGVWVIISSAVLGTLFRYIRHRSPVGIGVLSLYLFGVLVHLTMVLLALITLPAPQNVWVFQAIFLPVMVMHPFGTVLIATLFLRMEQSFQLQQALTESEAKYRALVENASSIIVRLNAWGEITFMNDYGLRFFGFSETEIIGSHAVNTIVPEFETTGRNLRAMMRDLVATPESYEQNVNQNARRDGTRVWISWTNRAVRDNRGKVVEVFSIGADITERKRVEDELRESRMRLDQLAVQNRIIIWEIDAQGLYTYVSPVSESVFGYAPGELTGRKYFYDLHPEDGRDSFRAAAFKVIAGKEAFSGIENRILAKNGGIVWVSTSGMPLLEPDGTLKGYRGFDTDITSRKIAQEALREREERLKMVVWGGDLGTWDWNVATGTVVFNERWAGMLGFSLNEIESHVDMWRKLVHPDDMAMVLESLTAHLEGKTANYEAEHRLRHKTGTWVWVLDKGRVIQRDGQGRALRACGTHLDITDRKQAEDALRASEQCNRQLLKSARDGFWLVDAYGVILDVNDSYCDICGYARGELIGKNIAELDAVETAEEVLARQEKIRLQGSDIFETRHRRRDGSLVPLEISVTFLPENGGCYFAFIRDITERRRLSHERENLLLALDNAAEAIMIADAGGIIRFVNIAAGSLGGIPPQDLLGRNLFYPGGETLMGDEFFQDLWRNVSNGKPWEGTMKHVRADGRVLSLASTIAPVKDEGGSIVNYIAVSRDITHEEELEAQLLQSQKLEAMGTLAAGIAHEFNNILAGIINYTEIARCEIPAGSAMQHYFDKVFMLSERARDVVMQILTFSRSSQQERKPVEIADLVREELQVLHPLMPSNIIVRNDFDDGDSVVVCDPSQMKQVVTNLCINAAHAMEPRGGELTVTLEAVDLCGEDARLYPNLSPGPYVRLVVSDTGTGIPIAVQDRIFDPFFTTKDVGEGSGMGLAIVLGIIRSHGGDIRCDSRPDRGATFTVLLPRSPLKAFSDDAPKQPPRGSERILVVDDEETVADSAAAMLESLGYAATAATSAAEALAVFKKDPNAFDLVITDLTMPNMSGDMLARSLQAVRPDIPVILSSGYSDVQKQDRRLIAATMPKPYTRGELAHIVRKALDDAVPN